MPPNSSTTNPTTTIAMITVVFRTWPPNLPASALGGTQLDVECIDLMLP